MGSEDFKHGGWNSEFDTGEGMKFKLDETNDSDALLLGRVTYEGSQKHGRPERATSQTSSIRCRRYVVSSTLSNPEWNNTTVLNGDLSSVIKEVSGKHDGNIVVHGSAQLVQGLRENDLLDELRLMVFPLLLGQGKRLFGETSDKRVLKLREAKTVGEGITINIYERARSKS